MEDYSDAELTWQLEAKVSLHSTVEDRDWQVYIMILLAEIALGKVTFSFLQEENEVEFWYKNTKKLVFVFLLSNIVK